MVKGQKIYMSEKVSSRRFSKPVLCIIKGFTKEFILLIHPMGYTVSAKINDARRGLYRFFRENGKKIKFKPLPDLKEVLRQEKDIEMADYRQEKACQNWVPKKQRVTHKQIIELFKQGMSDKEISVLVGRSMTIVNSALARNGYIECKSKREVAAYV